MDGMKLSIGKSDGRKVEVDLMRLIGSRALAIANSGGGKSWLLRLIAEQAAPHTQTIVIDPEGEFGTLREKYDFLLVAKDGEIEPDPKAAKLLARKLAELRISAVIDLFDLHPQARRSFVRYFAEAIVELPKQLWGPRIVMVDEAHTFCPEKGHGEAESTNAIIGLMSLGRKRGLCGILATQRISKLHKDAAAECQNVFIGKTTLDVDQRRAGDIMGVGKEDARKLRDLEPLNFHAFGPALSMNGVFKVVLAKVTTTHPRDGQRHTITAPQPSKLISKVLPEFADLAKKAESEIRDMAAAKTEIAKLKRELTAKPRPDADAPTIERAVNAATKQLAANHERTIASLQRALQLAMKFVIDVSGRDFAGPPGQPVDAIVLQRAIESALDAAMKSVERGIAAKNRELSALKAEACRLVASIEKLAAERKFEVDIPTKQHAPLSMATTAPTRTMSPRPAPTCSGDSSLGKGVKRNVMIALCQYPQGLTKKRLAALAGASPSGGGFGARLSELRTAGFIEQDSAGVFIATPEGIAAVGDFEPLPTGEALIDYWRGRIGGGIKRAIFDALVAAYPEELTKDAIAEQAGASSSGGGFGARLSELRTIGLIEGSRQLKASPELFE